MTFSPVVELRRYAMQPGRRDDLIELFDREFLETQEAAGMTVIAQFRDLGDADSFVWLRGFADMAARRSALTAFYGGPVWARFRDQANATMANSDNVFLLRPARAGSGFADDGHDRPAPGATGLPAGFIAAVTCHLAVPADDALVQRFEAAMAPDLAAAGAPVIATFVTEAAENSFPRLPVRAGENVLVFFCRLAMPDAAALRAVVARHLPSRVEIAVLQPTARSRLR